MSIPVATGIFEVFLFVIIIIRGLLGLRVKP